MNLLKEITPNGKLFCGDCIEIMKTIPDESIDFILCDPPFGITQNIWDIIIPFDAMWTEYNRIIKEDSVIAIFSSQPFTSQLVMSNIEMFKYEWIWEKTIQRGHLNAKKMPLRTHENIVVFSKSRHPIYIPQMTQSTRVVTYRNDKKSSCYGKEKATRYDSDKRYPRDILKMSNSINRKDRIHSTQKPTEIYEYFIKTYTNENDTVLDNCAGSGVIGVACENLNRNYIMIEQSEEMCSNIVKRITDIKSVPKQMSLC